MALKDEQLYNAWRNAKGTRFVIGNRTYVSTPTLEQKLRAVEKLVREDERLNPNEVSTQA